MAKVKKSSIAVAIGRLILVGLAYQHVVMPKGALLPPGTQKTLWISLKNFFKIGRTMTRAKLRSARLLHG